jgi:ABC-type dipeptide/oligopeptide/nickel transport system permease subunit
MVRPAPGDLTPAPLGTLPPGLEEARPPQQAWRLYWRRLRRDRLAVASAIYLALLIIAALCAPLIARAIGHPVHSLYLYAMTTKQGLPKGPNGSFLFGADTAGHDLLVWVIYGARTSLLVAVVATGVSVLLGTVLGLAAAMYGRVVDGVLSGLMDIILSLPVLLLALGIAASCGGKSGCVAGAVRPGLPLVIAVIAIANWVYIGRIVRGEALALREREWVEAARMLGMSNRRIMFRHLLPNLTGPILVYATLAIPNNILFEATLSFLGAGVSPDTPSWGREIADATGVYTVAWWTMVFPGAFLFLTMAAFNLLGDGLRDAVDMRSHSLEASR